MLEFHYEEQDHGSKRHKSKHQRVPSYETAKEHVGINIGGGESTTAATVPSLTKQASLPISSAVNPVESMWNSGTMQ